MPQEAQVRVVRAVTRQGYNADRDAVTLLARVDDPVAAVERVVEMMPQDALTVTSTHVRETLDEEEIGSVPRGQPDRNRDETAVSGGDDSVSLSPESGDSTVETVGGESSGGVGVPGQETDAKPGASGSSGEVVEEMPGTEDSIEVSVHSRPADPVTIAGDITGESTGTGEYEEFVAVFRDRYERLAAKLQNRVNRRPTDAIETVRGGSDAAIVGMISDIRSTPSGHWLVELEDTNGVFPCLILKDREIAPVVDELLLDEVIAVEGTLADDGGVLFADTVYFPDVPRTHSPSTADRPVQAALISDIHVGSQEFMDEAWDRFAEWLHTDAADGVEYLLIAGDMVEGVGVYPDQETELAVVDIYEQYERFAEHLKAVPADLEIVMIPGNHDAVRLAEPQPGFDEDIRDILAVHDAHIAGNPATVTIEGVSILMYHGVSLDELVAELPGASYDEPASVMSHLLRKRHLAPTYGGKNRLAPEDRDYLVIDEVPDVLHAGHVHKLGVGDYHGVRTVNSGCWQEQTPFQRSVNIDPDPGYAPILDLETLEVTVRKFH